MAVAGVMAVASPLGMAANGMNAPGYGAVQLGLAGAGTALTEDGFATLRNPAAGAWIEDLASFDLGIALPRGGSRVGPVGSGSQLGLIDIEPGDYDTIQGVFPIPSFARNWRLGDRHAVGWGVVASGLKATTRGGSASLARGLPAFDARCGGSFAGSGPVQGSLDLMGLCGSDGGTLGVDLTQALLSGSYAFRVGEGLSVGVGPVIAFQRLMVRGLGAFAAFSNRPDHVADNGFDHSFGGGVRVGALWEVTDSIGLAAAYQSRLYQTRFDRYDGAIIGGSLDFAPTLNLGLQVHPVAGHRLLLDLERIYYGSVRPLGNTVDPQRFADECFIPRLAVRSAQPAFLAACLGGPSGPGFGWDDVTVYKLGYQGVVGPATWRAGFSWGGNPIRSGQTLPKFFAPAVTDQHVSLGLSWKRPHGATVDIALLHAIENHVRERNVFSNAQLTFLDGNAVGFRVDPDALDQRIDSHVEIWQLHVSYSWRP